MRGCTTKVKKKKKNSIKHSGPLGHHREYRRPRLRRLCSTAAVRASFGTVPHNSHVGLRFLLRCLSVAVQRGNAMIALQGLSMLQRSVASSVRSLNSHALVRPEYELVDIDM